MPVSFALPLALYSTKYDHIQRQSNVLKCGVFRLVLCLALALPVFAKDQYLFTSFRNNGETGVFLALSQDGQQWNSLNSDKPWLKPEIPGMLMRDPWLGRGPDGVWHLLWTCGWTRPQTGGLVIGHASSKDLLNWSPQEQIPVLAEEPTAMNAWAPEAVWDPAKQRWIVFWATTIPAAPAKPKVIGEKGYDHRIYAATTKDWKTWEKAKRWFDPGFNCIDSTLVHDGDRWVMIFKDERVDPLQKRLRLAFSHSPDGPWTSVSEPFSGDWVEGPTAIRIGAEWWIYFDHYRSPQRYGAIKTRDWKTFEDETEKVSFPSGQRHGTAVVISEELAETLRRQER